MVVNLAMTGDSGTKSSRLVNVFFVISKIQYVPTKYILF